VRRIHLELQSFNVCHYGRKNDFASIAIYELSDRFSVDSNNLYILSFTAGEVLNVSEQFLVQNMHPTVIIGAYRQALEDMQSILKDQIR